jgi:hypothetical protein
MMLRMVFCGFFRLVGRIQIMPMGNMGVMPCLFVMTLLVILGGFFMMLRSLFMMFSRLLVMLGGLVFMMYRGLLLMLGGPFLMVRRPLFVLLVSVFRHKVGVLRLTPARDRLRFLDSIFHLLQEHEGHAFARLLMTERRDYFALSPGFLFALASVFFSFCCSPSAQVGQFGAIEEERVFGSF